MKNRSSSPKQLLDFWADRYKKSLAEGDSHTLGLIFEAALDDMLLTERLETIDKEYLASQGLTTGKIKASKPQGLALPERSYSIANVAMKVFIGNISSDLNEEREAIALQIEILENRFVGIEHKFDLPTNRSDDAYEAIKDADVVVFVIDPYRDGREHYEENSQLIIRQYDTARDEGKHILVYKRRADQEKLNYHAEHNPQPGELHELLNEHIHKEFSSSLELALLIQADLFYHYTRQGTWCGVSWMSYQLYERFWDNVLGTLNPKLVFEYSKYAPKEGESEVAKNINGARGIVELTTALVKLGARPNLAPSEDVNLNTQRTLIFDGSHIGNSMTDYLLSHPDLVGQLIFENKKSEDEYIRWLENSNDPSEKYHTLYKHRKKIEDSHTTAIKYDIEYDFGVLSLIDNPFNPHGKCIIASGNHGAGTFACMKVLASPDLLRKVIEEAEYSNFQAVIGIGVNGLFDLGEPEVIKVVPLENVSALV